MCCPRSIFQDGSYHLEFKYAWQSSLLEKRPVKMSTNFHTNHKMLRVLCLHGYRQNGHSFREKLGAFRKIMKNRMEFVFITAPHRVPRIDTDAAGEKDDNHDDQRGWWFSGEDDSFRAVNYSDICRGFDESVQLVKDTVEKQGPFDGLLGFSQGGAMASLFCAQLQREGTSSPFKFVIIIAGFVSRSTPHNILYEQPVSLPSLHVYGQTDQVISQDMSEELEKHFTDSSHIIHPGGHFVPASSAQKTAYWSFIDGINSKTKEQ